MIRIQPHKRHPSLPLLALPHPPLLPHQSRMRNLLPLHHKMSQIFLHTRSRLPLPPLLPLLLPPNHHQESQRLRKLWKSLRKRVKMRE